MCNTLDGQHVLKDQQEEKGKEKTVGTWQHQNQIHRR